MTQPQNMSESNKFIRDIIWVAISQIFTNLLSFITLPALTKTYTTEIFGVYTQVLVTVGFLAPIITLQFVTAMVRFLAGEEDKDKRLRSIGAMLYTVIIFACVILAIGNIWASQISFYIFGDSAYNLIVRLAFFLACANAIYLFLISYLRARGKIKRLSIIQIALFTSRMGCIVGLVLSGFSLQWVIVGMMCVYLIFILYLLFNIIREVGFPVPNFSGLSGFLAFSVPQIPTGILTWIMSVSDRYFITHFIDLSQTGIYASSSTLAGLISLFYFPIGYVLLPVVSRTWEQNKKAETKVYFEYSTRLFLTLAIPGAVGLSMLSQTLLVVLTTPEYLAGITLVLLIAISQIFEGMFQLNTYIVYLVKQTKWLPLMIVTSTGISIGLNVALIPYIGIVGAAISKIVAYFLLAIIVTIWANKALNYEINLGYIAKIICASMVMAVCLYFLNIGGIIGFVISVITGLTVFVILMILMKAFTQQDRQLLKNAINTFLPWKQ